jgi:hypothetical protein
MAQHEEGRQVSAIGGTLRIGHSLVRFGIALGLIVLPACASPEAESAGGTGETGTARQAIADGVRDEANLRSFVGALDIEGRGKSCSAVLITPLWVATANHCISGTIDNSNCFGFAVGVGPAEHSRDDMVITFAQSTDDAGPFGEHTQSLSGNVLLRVNKQMATCSNEDAAKDVALIKLDHRVPLSAVRPKHPPINGVQRCDDFVNNGGQGDDEDDDNFEGMLIGFGRTGSEIAPGDPVPYRTWRTSANWDREDVGGFVYRNSWKFTSTYTGNLAGDSGGPLLTTGGGELLCGISSRYYPDLDGLGVGASAAALDSPDNLQFLNDHVLTSGLSRIHGFTDGTHFTGECEKSCIDPDTDTDDDGWPDCCDNCPRDKNLDQVDTDGDGFGEECDLCPGVTARDQSANCNLEAELGTHFGGQQPPASTPTRSLIGKIVPDACDPTPCAEFNVRGVAAQLDPQGRTIGERNALPPGIFISAGVAPPPQVITSCTLGIFECTVTVDTELDVGAKAGSTPNGAQAGSYNFQHCDCDANTATPQGRAACHGAPWYCFAGTQTNFNSGWRKIPVLGVGETWTQARGRYNSGLDAVTTSVFDTFHQFDDTHLFYDFTVLPYATGVTPGAPDFGQPSVRGILRSRVETHPNVPNGSGIAQVYRSGAGFARAASRPSQSFDTKFGNNDLLIRGGIPWPCGSLGIQCPPVGVGDFIMIKGGPAVDHFAFGMVPSKTGWSMANGQPGVTETLLGVVDRVTNGTERVIVAAEPPSRLSERGLPLRAVLLDANSHLSSLLAVRPTGGYDIADLCDGPCQQTIQNSEIVLNAEHGRLFSFGDGKDRVVQEQLRTTLPLGTVRTDFPLRPGFRPATVLAGTWDMDGDALYAVDRSLLLSSLKRWQYGSDKFETIALWPNTFSLFDRRWLVFGTEGDLIYVASKHNGLFSVLVRFTIDVPTQRVRFAGVELLNREIVTRPLVVRGGVQVLVPDDQLGFRYQMLPFTGFSFGDPIWHPRMQP